MRLDLEYFKRYLAEIEERTTSTHILASYFKNQSLSIFLHDPVHLNYNLMQNMDLPLLDTHSYHLRRHSTIQGNHSQHLSSSGVGQGNLLAVHH